MKRSLALVFVGFVLVACRAIVGIEDQSVGEAGAGPPGKLDSGVDARTDAGTDAGADAGGCLKSNFPDFGACGQCCHGAHMNEFDQLVQVVRTSCICGHGSPGTCSTQCTTASGDCTAGAMPTMACAPCIDQAVADGTCQNVTCGGPGCADIVACLRGCR